MPVGAWIRPLSVPYPSVWSSFERTINTKRLFFKIQDITPDLFDSCVDYMTKQFLKDEALSMVFDILNDPVSLDEQIYLWRKLLNDKLALVCLVKEENDPKSKIAGLNFNYYHHISHEDYDWKLKGEKINKQIDVILYVENKIDQYQTLGITEYINAYGLSVNPDYRGLGLATELLKAREPLGKAVGLNTTITMFSSLPAQKAAEKAGFKNLVEIDYDELNKTFPEFIFSIKDTPTIRYMYKQFT